MIGIFGFLSLVIASVGLFGLMAYSVERRRREIGIRLALGCARFRVAMLVLAETAALVATGMVIGTFGAVLLGRALSASLYGVTPTDPPTLAAVLATLAAVALLASAVPTLRAATADPFAAIRQVYSAAKPTESHHGTVVQ